MNLKYGFNLMKWSSLTVDFRSTRKNQDQLRPDFFKNNA